MNRIRIDDYITVMLGKVSAYVFSMKVKDLLPIYYVAVRGRDEVEGAVQRVLNKRRINSIKEFVLENNSFFNMFILNWTDDNCKVEISNNAVTIPIVANAAQVIDGQHRLEGLKQAYEIDERVGEQEIIILLLQNLTTPEAARIFLNINTEQKPVPSSLVYDLFGEIKEKDYYIVRATDIACRLHEESESPLYQLIKMPGAAKGIGKIDLSTVVNSLKQYTKEKGVFDEYHLNDFESQFRIIFNFFSVLRDFYDYDGNWLKSINPFLTNAGCYAGIDFMCKELIPKCAERKSFEIKTLKELLPLEKGELIFRDELKNVQGKEQRKVIYGFLKNALLKDVPNQDEYKF